MEALTLRRSQPLLVAFAVVACGGDHGAGPPATVDVGGGGSSGSAVGTGGSSGGSCDAPVDSYGGTTLVTGEVSGRYHVDKVGDRWWMLDPAGHGLFVAAVSSVNYKSYYSSGGFLSYDAVYVQPAGGARSSNLGAEAASSIGGDVVPSGGSATLAKVGDAIYLGWRSRPYVTYFWLDTLGAGGKIDWYYSKAGGDFALVNGSGKPAAASLLDADGGYGFDIGNDIAPDGDGFGQPGNPNSDRVWWWDLTSAGFPSDFAPTTLPNDAPALYYVKGVVTADFSTPPVVSQAYERETQQDAIQKKYGPDSGYGKWAKATTERLRSWGFTAAGYYSYFYAAEAAAASLEDRLPISFTWTLSSDAMNSSLVKNVYSGAVCPPKSGQLVWQGNQADAFDPNYTPAMKAAATAWYGSDPIYADETAGYAVIPEEGDDMFGIDAKRHEHMGYVVPVQNPYMPSGTAHGNSLSYADARFYAKYALRDFLRDRYRDASDTIPELVYDSVVPLYAYAGSPTGAELAALDNLNTAWGTSYTTWDTSGGSLSDGSNAWATGTGVMDEDGSGVLEQASACKISYADDFTNPAHPAIRKDLDDFVVLFATRYGKALSDALDENPHPPSLMPLYDAPPGVAAAIAPYVDAFWIGAGAADDVLAFYNAVHKPLVLADYSVANPDSPLFIRGQIASVTYDAGTDRTRISAPDLRYTFRLAHAIWFPEVAPSEFQGGGCGYLVPYVPLRKAEWNELEVSGDYTGCVEPGMHVELADPQVGAICRQDTGGPSEGHDRSARGRARPPRGRWAQLRHRLRALAALRRRGLERDRDAELRDPDRARQCLRRCRCDQGSQHGQPRLRCGRRGGRPGRPPRTARRLPPQHVLPRALTRGNWG